MNSSDLMVMLLLGVSAGGVVLGVVVFIATLVQRRLDNHSDEAPEEDEDVSKNIAPDAAEEEPEEALSDLPAQDTPNGLKLPSEHKVKHISEREKAGEDRGNTAVHAAEEKTAFKAGQAAVEIDLVGIEKDEPFAVRVGDFSVRISSAKHKGARKEQQDAIAHSGQDEGTIEKSGLLSVICDGMGGMKMGGEAAQLASRVFIENYLASSLPSARALKEAVDAANERVWELCQADDLSGAGTTLVAALVTKEGFHYISVGDSHVYLYRGGVLSQLNVDHNYLSELLKKVRRGEITREQALSDPERAHLTSYLGIKKLALIDRSSGPIDIEDGDRILLASDGLFKVLTPSEIAAHLENYADDVAEDLIGEVLRYQYRNQDNVSVALIALDKAQ